MGKRLMTVALCLALGGAGAALADDDCHVPMERWQPRAAVLDMARAQGWQVGKLRIDDGCYEIRGTDAQGLRFKAKIDPETLKVVKWKTKGDDDDARRRDRRHQADGKGGTPAAPPDGGLFEGGSPPKVIVK